LNIILFGPPGAGKGTQSALLVEQMKMNHISTGNLLRAAVSEKTALGVKAKSFMDSGKLVPDDIVIGLVEDILQKVGSQGFILDGFPRTAPQAEALEGLFKKLKIDLKKVVFLEVEKAVLLKRLTGRRVCEKCGAVYHIENNRPKVDGQCDKCGSKLVHRSDDSENVISQRLVAYETSTSPVKDFYKKRGLLVEIDGSGEAKVVFERIKKALN
jgi:adenylate kinase